jgi:hypothetical protein
VFQGKDFSPVHAKCSYLLTSPHSTTTQKNNIKSFGSFHSDFYLNESIEMIAVDAACPFEC